MTSTKDADTCPSCYALEFKLTDQPEEPWTRSTLKGSVASMLQKMAGDKEVVTMAHNFPDTARFRVINTKTGHVVAEREPLRPRMEAEVQRLREEEHRRRGHPGPVSSCRHCKGVEASARARLDRKTGITHGKLVKDPGGSTPRTGGLAKFGTPKGKGTATVEDLGYRTGLREV